MEPVLTKYFAFLQDVGWIKNSQALINRLQKVTPLMVELAHDFNNWGPGKQLAIHAEELGFDFSDEEAIQKYLELINEETPEVFKRRM